MNTEDLIRDTLCKSECFGNQEVDFDTFFDWFWKNSETHTHVIWPEDRNEEGFMSDQKYSFKEACCHINSIYNGLNYSYEICSGVGYWSASKIFIQHSYNIRNLGHCTVVNDFTLYNDPKVMNDPQSSRPKYRGVLIPKEFVEDLIRGQRLDKDTFHAEHPLNKPLFAELYKSKNLL